MAEKELYNIGEIPPLGFVPKKMHAYVIHPEHHGPPLQAMKSEVVDLPEIGPNEVLVQVMTAGVNFNGVCQFQRSLGVTGTTGFADPVP
jgi:crotonyl-CoA carboxylase/reductase